MYNFKSTTLTKDLKGWFYKKGKAQVYIYAIIYESVRYFNHKHINMSNNMPSYQIHPIIQAMRSLVSKLRQNPEIYPIKHYKKSQRFRRNWKTPLVK